MSRLAIYGGKPVRKRLFPFYRTVGKEEKKALCGVIDSGVLSEFLGSWDEKYFFGGPGVRRLEGEWAKYFGVKHAVAVNSCTSGLYCAAGAAGISLGDEVIVSPYTMSASATAAVIFQGVPVFADIEEDYFCLDPVSVEERITSRTRAIIVVDIFGQPYDADRINAIARRHKLAVIEDAAQAPGARYKRKYAGTLADIGVFSLNCHKHIQCGEGGIVVTDNDELADRVRLIRNHAEAVVGDKKQKNLVNMIGYNFRMTELEAAVSICQLKKLKGLLGIRQNNCRYLESKLGAVPAIVVPPKRPHCEHAYYIQPFKFDKEAAGVGRDLFLDAVRAELAPTEKSEDLGVRIWGGYVRPLYMQPMYQKRIAYGRSGLPFGRKFYKGKADYSKGSCPVAERMYGSELFINDLMHAGMKKNDLDDVVRAFEKVWENRSELKRRSSA
ncbi:MAG: DegT/DnrJ/EryC1/StrS family aminotransferase [Candidatus Omnitrophica bacterium]|nr:DegT/DnrJ/EryC1/StrS family aminotransferase [Candidatus Omnitrophota bacterium]MDD5310584.1 DegT/DnrJ/EryC1/StrS family aminotransferase [Candidatus Omnitrophota bacterium]MDD5545990.1 DegT/DnrJ/EryC1/StrS family aminotransferase [Candidatus Omnitrophota bacterium]